MLPNEIVLLEYTDKDVHILQCANGKPRWLPTWAWPSPSFKQLVDHFLKKQGKANF